MNRYHLGLLLCGMSALLNIDGVISVTQTDGPPIGVGIGSAIVGLATLAGVALAWRRRKGGLALTVVPRLISAAAFGLPTYFIGAPGWVYATVGAGMALSAAGLAVLWASRDERVPV
jgi:hypothetical protein